MTEAILVAEHLSWHTNGQTLVDDISVEIPDGAVVALVGPSGAGKTSFMRLLNRLSEPSSGRVLLNGTDTSTLDPQELRRRVGMMLQAPYLFPGTVAENIRFGPAQRGDTLPTEQVAMLLQRVDLEGYAERNVSNLSVGEAQRVSLARTLANHPEVLLLDEPTSALDAEAERSVEALLTEIIADEGLTCLIVTHDIDQAERITASAMLIKAGRLVAFGPTKEIINAEPALR